jgi:AraC-like DNA-binding protein
MPWSRVLSFTDPQECQAAVQASQVEILPTAKGSFHVEITQIGMNRLWMQRFNVALPQVATARSAPDRKAIGFLIEANSSDLQHSGIEVAPGDIIVSGFDARHQLSSSGFHYGAMSVPVKDFPDLCRTIIGREFLEGPDALIVRPDPALMSRLLRLHRAVGQLAHDTPDLLDLPEVRRALEEQLIHVMVRCLADGASIETTAGGRRHDAIVARFEEFLAANPGQPLYLTEICATIGVAERTLRASCEEHLGMGPIRFLTLRRMHLVHHALLRADPSKSTVTRIVTDHGFWELGRFSAAYRTLFGEPPSETLRRPAARTAINLNRPSSLAAAEVSSRAN